jgi:hypothetical protein
MEVGDKDFSAGPDDALLSLDNTVCEGLSDSGLNFGRVSKASPNLTPIRPQKRPPRSHRPPCDTLPAIHNALP